MLLGHPPQRNQPENSRTTRNDALTVAQLSNQKVPSLNKKDKWHTLQEWQSREDSFPRKKVHELFK